MTDKEAIANMTYYRNAWIGLQYNEKGETIPWISGVLEEAMHKGVKAIQEKIEREKGCEYCKYDGCELCLNKGDMTICEDCADNVWTYCNHYKKSYFCRRCGRKLKGEEDD